MSDATLLAQLEFDLELRCEFGQHGDNRPPATHWFRTTNGVVAACAPHAAQHNGPAVLGPIRPAPV